MSTTHDDVRTGRHLLALAALVLVAIAPLAVTLLWLFNLGCPQWWHLAAGPLALALVIYLIGRVWISLGTDPLTESDPS